MTPIQKAKEILDSFYDFIYQPGMNESWVDKWLESEQAAALLSGEDWKEDGWVRVQDRLPDCRNDLQGNKASDDLLIFVNGEVHSGYLESVRPDFKKLIWSPNIGDDCLDIEEYHGQKVTHWMPLPEPPKP